MILGWYFNIYFLLKLYILRVYVLDLRIKHRYYKYGKTQQTLPKSMMSGDGATLNKMTSL